MKSNGNIYFPAQPVEGSGASSGVVRCGNAALWEGPSGECHRALPRNAFFFPVEIQPPLEDNFPQDNTEDPKVQIPEEPSHLDQPVTSDTSVSEAWQKPDTEKDADPGKAG